MGSRKTANRKMENIKIGMEIDKQEVARWEI